MVVTLKDNEYFEEGYYEIGFDTGDILRQGKNITSGVYFYSLTAGDFSAVKKMVLIK
jgi:hypothetical protein